MIEPSIPKTNHINIVAGGRLSPGAVVSARVLERLPGGRFVLLLNGRRLTAESHLKLRTGETLRALVERQGGQWKLRLLPQRSDSSQAPTSSAESFDSKNLLFASLLRTGSGLPDENTAARWSALLSRTRGRRLRSARLYAELLNRGADPTADFLEYVEELLYGKGNRDPGRNPRRSWPEPPEASELKNDLAEDDQDPLLDLLSRVPDRDGQWTFRAYRRRVGDRDFNLVVKFKGFGVPALALTVHDGNRTLEFLVEGLSPARLKGFRDEHCEIDPEQWQEFRKRLALMNVEVDDTLSLISESDGFSSGAAETLRELEDRL